MDIVLFTGLQDKHKKDIYEGDIIKGVREQHPVVFEKGYFSWAGTPLIYDIDHGLENEFLTEDWAEVIGNIHQHPELLTK